MSNYQVHISHFTHVWFKVVIVNDSALGPWLNTKDSVFRADKFLKLTQQIVTVVVPRVITNAEVMLITQIFAIVTEHVHLSLYHVMDHE